MAAVSPIVGLLLVILTLVLVYSAVLALRHRLPFRIAMRNVRRAKGRTVLLLLGLLVGTSIISGSLIVGDTVNELDLHYTYLAIGYADEIVVNATPTGGNAPFAYSVYTGVAQGVAGDSSIAGVAPMIVSTAQGYDRSTAIPQTNLNLIGANGNQSAALGPFTSDAGQSLAGPAPGEAFLDDLAASEMNASVGNTILLYGATTTPVPVTVQAIVQDDIRGGFLTAGIGTSGSVFLDLATSQRVESMPNEINWIAVTNVGSQQAGLSLSDQVSAKLNATLATVPGTSHLTVQELLQQQISIATSSGSGISTIFLVLGLFSIVAGAMLIIGIFVMLAEERKGEMGMLRAIGLRQKDLIRTFYFEGLAYSLGSAFAGTLAGVGVGYGLTVAFSVLFASGNLTPTAILASFTVTTSTLVISYVAGFLITIVTVYAASRRASRLNIVRAIRDIPEPPPTIRLYTLLAYVGVVVALLGALLFATTYRGSSDESYPLIAGTMLILGLAFIGSRFVPNRIVFSAAGAAFLLWAGVEPLHAAVLGSVHTGGIFLVFVEGIIMVAGALFLYIFNSQTVVDGLTRIAGGRSGRAPVARVGFSYPGRQPTRTTINLAIFALVVFTLVAIATFGGTVDANLAKTVGEQSGGYTFFGISQTPIPDLPGQIANNSSLRPLFSAVVPLIYGGIDVNVTGFAYDPFGDAVYSAPTGLGPSSDFYSTNQFTFTSTWHGLSASQVFSQLATNDSVAIVDQSYAPVTQSFGSGPTGPHPTVSVGQSIALDNPATGNATTVTVIGILTEGSITGIWLSPAEATALGYGSERASLLTVAPGVDANHAAQLAKSAFFPYGLVLIDFAALLAQSISSTEGIVGLLQIFVGLGLAVGVAAMGIIAIRAVTERRREIGMLRANGFTRRMILSAFLLEFSFVALLGIGIGTSLGILIVYDLSISAAAKSVGVTTFVVPWTNILLILLLSYSLALAAVASPSLRAARLPPAEAVRPTE